MDDSGILTGIIYYYQFILNLDCLWALSYISEQDSEEKPSVHAIVENEENL